MFINYCINRVKTWKKRYIEYRNMRNVTKSTIKVDDRV